MKRVCMLTLCIVGMVLYSSMRSDRGITIFMVGDSTMADKDTSGGKQERGGVPRVRSACTCGLHRANTPVCLTEVKITHSIIYMARA